MELMHYSIHGNDSSRYFAFGTSAVAKEIGEWDSDGCCKTQV